MVGSRSPGRSWPVAISVSIRAAMVAAPAPGPIDCTSGSAIMYYNIFSRRNARWARGEAPPRGDVPRGQAPHRGRRLGLSRQLWIVQAGIFLNALGWGAVLPFEVIYLHSGRGFSLGVAGSVIGVFTGLAVVAS